MASYKYRSIITVPAEQARATQTTAGQGLPRVITREEADAEGAIRRAHGQHRMPAGTRVRIERIRSTTKSGAWMRYRAYEVSEAGRVVRTDR